MSKVIAITGANRGLGLEFVKQYSQDSNVTVIAYQRSDDRSAIEALKKDNVKIIKLDAADDEQVKKAVEETKKITKSIDILINNAAINTGPFKLTEPQDLSPISKVHDTNVLGPIRVTTSFLPLLREGKDKKVIFISSGVASLTRTVKKSFGPMAPYAMSKTGLNMVVALYSVELSDEGFTCLAFDPGHVQTDMGGGHAPLTPPESIKNMIAKISSVSPEVNGKFFAVKGDPGSTKMEEEDW
ncbi:hypothetical protein HD553DRAFT_350472 [Filobasidium floriforme]|uniref:uncharacterized protein n=1 Tax=Filobasidium floriforme TaxID=5210 RepID=UPI001E8E1E1B|nr:uncharacterized protein HD553DRAFT_350472 [Filobasidium floriforme]KAH8084270.1 hypothetical protein HD553DRAFT_350472 [Filobasidium floriforme]